MERVAFQPTSYNHVLKESVAALRRFDGFSRRVMSLTRGASAQLPPHDHHALDDGDHASDADHP